jgi:hypothetical protein
MIQRLPDNWNIKIILGMDIEYSESSWVNILVADWELSEPYFEDET